MGWYLTAYPAHSNLPSIVEAGSYGSNLWAPDWSTAIQLIEQRGCNEYIVSGPSNKPIVNHPSVAKMIRRKAPWKRVLHAACYMCWHACKAKVVTPDEVLGDGGLIHGIAHALSWKSSRVERARLAEIADDIEVRIPGWREDYDADL